MRYCKRHNGEVVETRYDALNRRSEIRGPEGADDEPLYVYANTYDLFGNLQKIEESYPSTGSQLTDRDVVNTYDAANRLTVETITTGSDTVVTAYSYDDAHNRTGKTVTVNSTLQEDITYTLAAGLNQVTGFTDSVPNPARTVTFSYDLAGNRDTRTEGDKVTEYRYDFENRLIEVEQFDDEVSQSLYAYVYDYRTRRVVRDESAAGGDETRVVFSGGISVQEWEVTGSGLAANPDVEFVRGSDWGGGIGSILYSLRAGDPSFNHYNSRGDVTGQTDDARSLTYQAAYEAFGRHGDTPSSEEWGSSADRQRANTKDEDPTGLLNEGFRYRCLETGVFMTRDPLGFVDGPNLYTYVVQNPWTKFDPLGLRIDVNTEIIKEQRVGRTFEGDRWVPHSYTVTEKHTSINFTASLIDNTGDSLNPTALGNIRDAISKGIKNQFTGRDGNHSFSINVDIEIAESARDIREGDHVINIEKTRPGQPQGWVDDVGGSSMSLSHGIFSSRSSRGGVPEAEFVAAGEFGHLAGLFHPNQQGLGSENSFIPSVHERSRQGFKDDFMDHAPGTGGPRITSDQISKIQDLYNLTQSSMASGMGYDSASRSRFNYINRGIDIKSE